MGYSDRGYVTIIIILNSVNVGRYLYSCTRRYVTLSHKNVVCSKLKTFVTQTRLLFLFKKCPPSTTINYNIVTKRAGY